MSDSNIFLKIIAIIVFVVLTFFGVVYILASPVDPTQTGLRLIIGVLLIIIAITLLVIILRLIQRTKYKIVKVKEPKDLEEETRYVPSEMICKNCGTPLEISEEMKKKEIVYCEKCGEAIKLPKDKVKW